MTLLPFILLVAGVGTVSIMLDRRLRAKSQADTTPAEERDEPAATKGSNDLGHLWATPVHWYNSLVNKQPEDFPQRFREWVVNASDDSAVTDWLKGLSDEGLKAYTKHLSRFCTDMGFELVWLVDKQLEKRDAQLAQTAKRIVLHYCQACQQAASCQEHLEAHKQLLSFEQNPGGRKNRTFGEKLLAKLVDADLVTTLPAEFIGASPTERQQLIAEAINEASSKDQATFSRLVREVLYDGYNGMASTEATASPGASAADAASGTEAARSA
ncbi:hypothetical protein [Candidatus Entotheonella palauensis]|uniref:Uncharacterized protein n=1 Tax=Candidatus Entotheonella gemina TaxID=1429439 RepID=W4M4F2_9BACT|nr:hypothetical protein [Candidatus Entotheonella palauensis]ETX05234.1 MAG: hypothetical protein ETSY2_24140 [Candidatus Entotheonella gemina]